MSLEKENIDIKNKPLGNQLKDGLYELATASTMHGIPNVLKTRHIAIKVIWMMFFLASSAVCVKFIFDSIQQYFSFEVVSSVRIIPNIPAEFPVITICNRNSLNTNYSYQEMKKYGVLVDNVQILLKYNSPLVTDAQRKLLGYSMEDMLIECSFSDRNCYAKDFVWQFDRFYLNCFSFNSGKNSLNQAVPIQKIYQSGSRAGLSVTLFVGLPEYLEEYNMFNGIYVFINNATYSSKSLKQIAVSPGAETNLIIDRTFVSQKPYPYSDCEVEYDTEFDSILYKKIKESNLVYSKQECYVLCTQKKIEEKCGCYVTFFSPISNKIPCSNLTQALCSLEVRAQLLNGDLSEECDKLCPIECKKIIYSHSFSFTNALSEKYVRKNYFEKPIITSKYANRNVTFDDIKSGLIKLNIYYDDLQYTEITESESVTFFNLLANVGGTFGLFIGISLLSFVEVIEVLYEIFYLLVTFRKSNKPNDLNV